MAEGCHCARGLEDEWGEPSERSPRRWTVGPLVIDRDLPERGGDYLVSGDAAASPYLLNDCLVGKTGCHPAGILPDGHRDRALG